MPAVPVWMCDAVAAMVIPVTCTAKRSRLAVVSTRNSATPRLAVVTGGFSWSPESCAVYTVSPGCTICPRSSPSAKPALVMFT